MIGARRTRREDARFLTGRTRGRAVLGRIPLDPALGTPGGFIGAQSEAFDAVAEQVFDALQRRAAA